MTTASLLPDFQRVTDVPADSIAALSSQVPQQIVDVWQAGQGISGDGYLRVVDPLPLVEPLHAALASPDGAVPVFVTAFGDIIFFREGRLDVAFLRYGVRDLAVGNVERLRRYVGDETFPELYLRPKLWPEARDALGVPELDECFGFVPLLVLGGAERVENLQRVKLAEHIDLLVQATGTIA